MSLSDCIEKSTREPMVGDWIFASAVREAVQELKDEISTYVFPKTLEDDEGLKRAVFYWIDEIFGSKLTDSPHTTDDIIAVDENQGEDSTLSDRQSEDAESSSDLKDEEGCYCVVRDPDEEVCDWCMDNRRKAKVETLEAVEKIILERDPLALRESFNWLKNELSKLKGAQK